MIHFLVKLGPCWFSAGLNLFISHWCQVKSRHALTEECVQDFHLRSNASLKPIARPKRKWGFLLKGNLPKKHCNPLLINTWWQRLRILNWYKSVGPFSAITTPSCQDSQPKNRALLKLVTPLIGVTKPVTVPIDKGIQRSYNSIL